MQRSNPFFRSSIVALLASVSLALGADPFTEGNVAYEQGKFDEASTAYRKALTETPANPTIHFNLGNARYRAGEPGEALLEYERALTLNPAFPEAAANLETVRRKTGARMLETAPWRRYIPELHPDAAALVACAAFWLTLFSATWLVLDPPRRGPAKLALAFSLSIALISAGILFINGPGRKDPQLALITAPAGTFTRFAPGENQNQITSLPPGSHVRLISRSGGWAYAAIPGNQRGWIPEKALDTIVPNPSAE